MSTHTASTRFLGRHLQRGELASRGLLSAVVEELGLRILGGTYEPGQIMPIETALMDELSISRTVLREALRVLAAKGMIESRTKVGTRVRERRYWNMLDPTVLGLYCQVAEYSDFARHFQQLRLIIEPEAAALAAGNRTAEQLDALEAAFQAMANATDVNGWTRADLGFHEAILDATGNPFIMPLASLIRTALETLLYHSNQSSADPFASLGRHETVMLEIRAGKRDAARKAMQVLLSDTSLSISEVLTTASRSPDAQ